MENDKVVDGREQRQEESLQRAGTGLTMLWLVEEIVELTEKDPI
jgi:hypothetical protein